jgi:histidinol dehydrogenase
MMKTILYPLKETWPALCRRPGSDNSSLTASVNDIIDRVRAEGDKALREFTLKFDKVSPTGLEVSEAEIESAMSLVPDDLRKAIILASENIEKFHRSQIVKEEAVITSAGVTCMRKSVPLEKVGLYIPGGSAPLFSTVLMLAIPAKTAGCEKVILCTPPGKDGKINPVILYSARLSGITEIFKVGGAQAIAAMAYGTETIPRVDKIFGPGNQYVTRAKEIVQSSGVAIDLPAGPSEVLVIADSSADPAFVAADLLSQTEHGPDSQVLLAPDNEKTLNSVKDEIKRQLGELPRKDIAAKSINNSLFLLLNNLQDCISFSNEYAPEHLIINTTDPWTVAGQVKNAGSVFVGRYSCESAGDYASGTNHTLPTNGYARSYSGVSTDSFIRKITFQEISSEGICNIGPAIQVMAEAEGLEAHKNAVSIRLKSVGNV